MKKFLIFIMVSIIITLLFNLTNGEINNNDLLRMVVYDKVNLWVAPDLNSKVIMTLSVTHVVKVEKEKDEIVEINGNKGKWVFVDTRLLENDGTRIKGWIFDYYLADKSKFVPVRELKCDMRLYCSFGDFDYTMDIKRDGTYVMNVIGSKEKSKGRLFLYKQAIVTVSDKYAHIPTFEYGGVLYLRKDGILCKLGANPKGGDSCAECVK